MAREKKQTKKPERTKAREGERNTTTIEVVIENGKEVVFDEFDRLPADHGEVEHTFRDPAHALYGIIHDTGDYRHVRVVVRYEVYTVR